MTIKEQKAYENIAKWRQLPLAKRRDISHKTAFSEVVGSMAMEGEPVSEVWKQQHAR